MELIGNLLRGVMNLLPISPFKAMLTAIDDSQVLSLLNWFIPFDVIVAILQTWAAAMVGYYAFRQIKSLIQSMISKFFS